MPDSSSKLLRTKSIKRVEVKNPNSQWSSHSFVSCEGMVRPRNILTSGNVFLLLFPKSDS